MVMLVVLVELECNTPRLWQVGPRPLAVAHPAQQQQIKTQRRPS